MEAHALADVEGIDQAVVGNLPGFRQAGQCPAILEIGADQPLSNRVDDMHAAKAMPKADIEGIAHRLGPEYQCAAVLRILRRRHPQAQEQQQDQ